MSCFRQLKKHGNFAGSKPAKAGFSKGISRPISLIWVHYWENGCCDAFLLFLIISMDYKSIACTPITSTASVDDGEHAMFSTLLVAKWAKSSSLNSLLKCPTLRKHLHFKYVESVVHLLFASTLWFISLCMFLAMWPHPYPHLQYASDFDPCYSCWFSCTIKSDCPINSVLDTSS